MVNLHSETVAMIIGCALEVGRDISPGCGRLRCCHVSLRESLPVATGADAIRRLLGHDEGRVIGLSTLGGPKKSPYLSDSGGKPPVFDSLPDSPMWFVSAICQFASGNETRPIDASQHLQLPGCSCRTVMLEQLVLGYERQ